MCLSGVWHRPLCAVSAGLWFLGAALAGFSAPFAAWRVSVAASLGFAAVAVGLVLLAWGTLRRARWAILVSLVGSGGQILGVAGSAWELIRPTDTVKSRELQSLGVDPALAFTVNLAYSTAATLIFLWALARWIGMRRVIPGQQPVVRD